MILWRVSHLLGSAICLICEKIRKIPVVPVCHRHTPAFGYLANHASLAIVGLPWPMTLTPTNEAIRHETRGKKTLSVKLKILTNVLGCHVIGVRIDFYQKA
jgi:hypothetical protein